MYHLDRTKIDELMESKGMRKYRLAHYMEITYQSLLNKWISGFRFSEAKLIHDYFDLEFGELIVDNPETKGETENDETKGD